MPTNRKHELAGRSMTSKQKANEICRKLNLPEEGVAFVVIERAIREQDRDTRHACVEALLNLDRHSLEDKTVIVLDDAQGACLNARAI